MVISDKKDYNADGDVNDIAAKYSTGKRDEEFELQSRSTKKDVRIVLEDGTQADEGTRSLVLEDGPKKKKESVTVLGSPLKRIVLEKETVSVDVSDKVGAKLSLNLKGALRDNEGGDLEALGDDKTKSPVSRKGLKQGEIRTASVYVGEDGNLILDDDGRPVSTASQNVVSRFVYCKKFVFRSAKAENDVVTYEAVRSEAGDGKGFIFFNPATSKSNVRAHKLSSLRLKTKWDTKLREHHLLDPAEEVVLDPANENQPVVVSLDARAPEICLKQVLYDEKKKKIINQKSITNKGNMREAEGEKPAFVGDKDLSPAKIAVREDGAVTGVPVEIKRPLTEAEKAQLDEHMRIVRVQSRIRVFLAKSEVGKKKALAKESALYIQCRLRSYLRMKFIIAFRRDRSAVKIQSRARGIAGRKRVKVLRKEREEARMAKVLAEFSGNQEVQQNEIVKRLQIVDDSADFGDAIGCLFEDGPPEGVAGWSPMKKPPSPKKAAGR